jgi:hypothetical protein
MRTDCWSQFSFSPFDPGGHQAALKLKEKQNQLGRNPIANTIPSHTGGISGCYRGVSGPTLFWPRNRCWGKKAEEKLAKLSGTDFDRAYAKMATDEQKRAVKQFEREAKNGKVPGIKDFAAKNLPAEQERQKQAEGMANAGTGTAGQQK